MAIEDGHSRDQHQRGEKRVAPNKRMTVGVSTPEGE
jgi:hypothetical protein